MKGTQEKMDVRETVESTKMDPETTDTKETVVRAMSITLTITTTTAEALIDIPNFILHNLSIETMRIRLKLSFS